MVRPALQFNNVELWTNAHVDRLIERDGRISAVELVHNGVAKSISAELIVVSCGAINSAALLLRSGVANSSGQVGRNFIKHNQTGLTSVHSKPNNTVFQKTLGVHDFYFGSPHHDYPLGTIQLTGKAHWTRVMGDVKGELPEEQAKFIADHAVDFFFTSEDLPDERNRIELVNGKIKFNYRPNNVAAHRELVDHFRDNYLRPMGFYMFLPWMMDQHVAWHQAGTCRFGEDPKQNVLDLNCKAHDLENLYVVDASFQPSMGATNPTLTIVANAIRVAEHLRRDWLKESAVNLHYPLSDGYATDSANARVK
jgi:choline dehydrogenase-like flavoprotein